MKMYLPFGDWSKDGHGQCEKILIDAPSMGYVRGAQIRMEHEYGKDIWDGFCHDYLDASISDTIQELLLKTNYPIRRFVLYMDDETFEEFYDMAEVFDSEYWNNDCECEITLDACIDMFIWLLNAHGARIEKLEDEGIPIICNWTCDGFRTVGYGCFDY